MKPAPKTVCENICYNKFLALKRAVAWKPMASLQVLQVYSHVYVCVAPAMPRRHDFFIRTVVLARSISLTILDTLGSRETERHHRSRCSKKFRRLDAIPSESDRTRRPTQTRSHRKSIAYARDLRGCICKRAQRVCPFCVE